VAESRGDFAAALQHAHRGLELAEELGLSYWLKGAHMNLATAHLQAGDLRAAVRAAEKAEEYPSTGQPPVGTHAEALYDLGQHKSALEIAAKAAATERLTRAAVSPTLVLARLTMRAEGAAGAAQVERILADVESRVRAQGRLAFLPFIARERAELARLLGDDASREHQLREAHRLFVEMGATGYAEQVAAELGL
jgi:tetratricopeptide (TPR) repeat protein